jgi:hypothetical protein
MTLPQNQTAATLRLATSTLALPLVLDWKIVSDTGAVVQSGGYTDPYSGSTGAIVGEYRARRGSRERIVVTIHQNVQAAKSHPRITIGLPERELRLGEEDTFLALGWAAIVSGSGLIILFVLLCLEAVQRRSFYHLSQ